MTAPRRTLVDKHHSGYYHCISRCVRRAFLCGLDAYTSLNYDHRKVWVHARLAKLLSIFAIDCAGFAVMSNHLHTVLRTDPKRAKAWSPEEVALRWRALFPRKPGVVTPEQIKEIVSNAALVERYRQRLTDLSWFHRCLNENIARRANAEDECTGRFWQGRFKCQALKSPAAVLACCVYVDLNPIRAGAASTPEESDYTSVQQRIRALTKRRTDSSGAATPSILSQREVCGLSEQQYIGLVDETARCLVEGKRSMPKDYLPIFERLEISASGWVVNARSQSKLFRRVIGPLDSLKALARQKGQQWFHGQAAAVKVFA